MSAISPRTLRRLQRFEEFYQTTAAAKSQRARENRQFLKRLQKSCPLDRTPEEHERILRANFPEYFEYDI